MAKLGSLSSYYSGLYNKIHCSSIEMTWCCQRALLRCSHLSTTIRTLSGTCSYIVKPSLPPSLPPPPSGQRNTNHPRTFAPARSFPPPGRSFIRCCHNSSTADTETKDLVEVTRHVLKVRPYYGQLHIKGNLNYVIKPDIEHQCGSVCSVRVLCSSGAEEVQIQQSDDLSHLTIAGHTDHHPNTTCEIILPIKYDLCAELTGSGSLEVLELHNDCTRISTARGRTLIHKLHSLHMHYTTQAGALHIAKKLLASLRATGDTLRISGNAVQAGIVDVQGQEVAVTLESLHAASLRVKASTATLRIRDITAHSQLTIDTADIQIGNCSGELQWQLQEGAVQVDVPQLEGDSCITLKAGDCSLACPAEYRYSVAASAERVQVLPGLPEVTRTSRGAMQHVTAGHGAHALQVTVQRGSVRLVPWTWPATHHPPLGL